MILSARLSPPFLLLLLLLSSAFFAWSSRVTKCSIAKPLDGAAGRFEARAQRIYLVYAIAPRSPLARSFVFCSSSSTLLLLCAISPALLLLLLCARASIARVVFPRRGIPPLDSWLSVSEGLWSSSSLFPLRSSLFALPSSLFPLRSPSSLSLFPLPLPSPSSSSSWQRPHVSDLRGPQPAAEHQGKLQLFCTRAGRGAASLRQQESKAPARPAAVYDMTCIRETGAAPAARCPIPNASAPCNHSHQSYPVFPAERARWLAGWPSRGARGVWSPTTEGGKSKRSLFRTRHDNSRGKEATPRVDRRLPQLRVPGEFAAPSLSGAHVSRA